MTAPPLDNDDLVDAILLRLPPMPSSLPRASAVCRRWRRIVSDPVFLRRVRLRHRHSAPLLGCFRTDLQQPCVSFIPTLKAPDLFPAARFYQEFGDRGRFRLLNCRHGFVLMFRLRRKELLVWDTITSYLNPLDFPLGFVREEEQIDGAVLGAAEDVRHFQVVLVGCDENDNKRAIARVYSSETGLWGNIVSTLLPDEVLDGTNFSGVPAVLVGGSIYSLVTGASSRILLFDLHRQMLDVITLPVDIDMEDRYEYMCMRAEGGVLGFLAKSGCKVRLWKREKDFDDVASWGMGRTIELDRLLFPGLEEKDSSYILGCAEYVNVVFLWTVMGHFTVELESLNYEEVFVTSPYDFHQPFECVYTGEIGIGGAPGGAYILHNA